MSELRPHAGLPGPGLPGGPVPGPGPRPATPGAGVLDLDWAVFGELCRALALRVAASGYAPELVLGIAKAGVIPGAVIASMLRCDFDSMKISRREGGERVSEEPQVLSAAPRQAAGRRVLIVDEICSTGATLRLALAAVRHVAPAEVRTAAAFARPGGYHPDFHALVTETTVIFPWDREVVDAAGELSRNPFYDTLLP